MSLPYLAASLAAAISAVIVLADRLTKIWVAAHIRLGGAIPVIPHVLRITHWTNEGAAFSLFADSASPHLVRWALIGFSLVAALAVLVALVRLGDRIHPHHRRARAHPRRSAGQRARPHRLRLGRRLH